MKKVLITGGAGFVGSHLTDLLIEKGYFVRIYDNLDEQVHGKNAKLPEYVQKHVDNNKAEFIKGDVLDYDKFKEQCLDVEYIIHLAAAVGVGQSMYKVKYYVDTNCSGTGNLLDIIVNNENKLEKLIVASSMSIYGEGSFKCKEHGFQFVTSRKLEDLKKGDFEVHCPICNSVMESYGVKEDKKLVPTSVYAVSKKDQEEMTMAIGIAYQIPTVALRFFNIYGPRQSLNNPYTGVAAIFSSAYLSNKAPIVFEDGKQSRDFIHVKDICRAINMCMENENANYEIFNVGTGRMLSVIEMANILSEKINDKIKPKIVNKFRAGDIRHCYADTTKIKDKIGFEAEIRFEDGIQDLCNWVIKQEADSKLDDAVKELKEKSLTI